MNPNIASLTGNTDAEQEAYLAAIKSAFPPVQERIGWIRTTRYGITATTGVPDWDTVQSRYWPNMYARAAAYDVMSTRLQMFSPILWIRQNVAHQFMTVPNAGPNYFGRDLTGGAVIADANNTWRNSIRANLDRLAWSDVGNGPRSSDALNTNMRIGILLGPNEVDAWTNARYYYVVDAECDAGAAPTCPARANAGPLSGTEGLQRLLTRIYDHQRHMFEWARERRPDVGVSPPALIQICPNRGTREFTIFEMLQFAFPGGAQGAINDVCDAHQIHPHVNQSKWIDAWTGAVPGPSDISGYHYWVAQQAVQATRVGLPDNTRPLMASETGRPTDVYNTGRTDIEQIARLNYGQLADGQLFYGTILNDFYSVGLSSATAYNVINPDLTYVGSGGVRNADAVFEAFDERWQDSIPFVAKTWPDFSKGWKVKFNQAQDPIDGAATVCPFPEWNRVSFADDLLTMNAGGANTVWHRKRLTKGWHKFSAMVRITGSGAQAKLRVRGHDKLNGLAEAASDTLALTGVWTNLEIQFRPRQHKNPRLPDPADCLLLIEHNGIGTCEVRNPHIEVPGRPTPRMIWNDEFNAPAGAAPDSSKWRRGWFMDQIPTNKWRNMFYDEALVSHDGQGNLVFRSELRGNDVWGGWIQSALTRNDPNTWSAEDGPVYVEARIDMSGMASSYGIWFAFWLLGSGAASPLYRELDMMEYPVGQNLRTKINSAKHWASENAGQFQDLLATKGIDVRTGFHRFGGKWETNRFTAYVDGVEVFTTPLGISEGRQYLVLSYEAGDLSTPADRQIWGQLETDAPAQHPTTFPTYVKVDYVRVFRLPVV